MPWLEGNLQTSQQPSQQQQQVIGNVTGAEQLIMQVVERTGMNAQYAELCLKEAGGDLERAVGMFVSNKVRLLFLPPFPPLFPHHDMVILTNIQGQPPS